jgi:hypothetical protein
MQLQLYHPSLYQLLWVVLLTQQACCTCTFPDRTFDVWPHPAFQVWLLEPQWLLHRLAAGTQPDCCPQQDVNSLQPLDMIEPQLLQVDIQPHPDAEGLLLRAVQRWGTHRSCSSRAGCGWAYQLCACAHTSVVYAALGFQLPASQAVGICLGHANARCGNDTRYCTCLQVCEWPGTAGRSAVQQQQQRRQPHQQSLLQQQQPTVPHRASSQPLDYCGGIC